MTAEGSGMDFGGGAVGPVKPSEGGGGGGLMAGRSAGAPAPPEGGALDLGAGGGADSDFF